MRRPWDARPASFGKTLAGEKNLKVTQHLNGRLERQGPFSRSQKPLHHFRLNKTHTFLVAGGWSLPF
jgi:hypothetical protein